MSDDQVDLSLIARQQQQIRSEVWTPREDSWIDYLVDLSASALACARADHVRRVAVRDGLGVVRLRYPASRGCRARRLSVRDGP